jgi:hypothetical protein
MKSEVDRRKTDTRYELLACVLDAAARIRKCAVCFVPLRVLAITSVSTRCHYREAGCRSERNAALKVCIHYFHTKIRHNLQ